MHTRAPEWTGRREPLWAATPLHPRSRDEGRGPGTVRVQRRREKRHKENARTHQLPRAEWKQLQGFCHVSQTLKNKKSTGEHPGEGTRGAGTRFRGQCWGFPELPASAWGSDGRGGRRSASVASTAAVWQLPPLPLSGSAALPSGFGQNLPCQKLGLDA